MPLAWLAEVLVIESVISRLGKGIKSPSFESILKGKEYNEIMTEFKDSMSYRKILEGKSQDWVLIHGITM